MSVKELLDRVKVARDALAEAKKVFRLVVERQVQQTSGGTFFVCLPKKWAQKVGLEKGGTVTVVWSKDDTLTILA